MKMKKKMLYSLFFICVLLISGCSKISGNETSKLLKNPYSKTEFLMGTVVTVKIYDEDKEDILNIAFDRIKDLADKITSEEHDSEVSLINQHAGKESVEVSAEVFQLIHDGKLHSDQSDGLFDISIGPLTMLWHIGFPDARKPIQSEIDAVLPLIDHDNIVLDEAKQTVFLTQADMLLDLGAIAKGYITDEAVTVLKEHDVTSAIVDLGGNVFVLGNHPSGEQWNVGIQDPDATRGTTVGTIKQSNHSIVTSGIYERYVEVDGEKYHHLLDPSNGYPFMNDIAGITIITKSSTDADALSTVGFAKGIKDGIKYIEEFTEAEAIFISHDNEVYTTKGLDGHFELTNEQFKMGETIP